MQLHTRKKWGGYVGSVVCVLRGRRIWSESSGIVRLTREDAKADAAWLCEQHEITGKRVMEGGADAHADARRMSQERVAYQWAVAEQGYRGTWGQWLAMSSGEREEYEAGARGEGTTP